VFVRPTPPHATDSVVYLWDADSGEQRGELRAPLGDSHPTALTFSPDGRHLAAIQKAYLRVWDVGSRAQVAYNRTGRRNLTALAFTPDGRRLVTASGDTSVRLWDTSSWGEVGGYDWDVGAIECFAVAPDGMRMAAGGGTGRVVIWDVD
jgi:WD40 repeat protein